MLKSRGYTRLISEFFKQLAETRVVKKEWTEPERFRQVQAFYLKHADQDWSFTDCLSLVVMRQLRIREALTKDGHFEQAGFTVLLRDK